MNRNERDTFDQLIAELEPEMADAGARQICRQAYIRGAALGGGFIAPVVTLIITGPVAAAAVWLIGVAAIVHTSPIQTDGQIVVGPRVLRTFRWIARRD
jgi:hypothetical protein